MTIEERAEKDSNNGTYCHPVEWNISKYAYIRGAKDQQKIDIQRAVEWMKSNHAETLFIEGDNGEKVGNVIDEFIKAMKGK